MALLYGQPRAASVHATSYGGARLYRLGRVAFRNLLGSHIHAAQALLEQSYARFEPAED